LQLNDKGEIRQPCQTPLPILNQSVDDKEEFTAISGFVYSDIRGHTVQLDGLTLTYVCYLALYCHPLVYIVHSSSVRCCSLT